MFFMLRILLVTVYISEINNFILRKASKGFNSDVRQINKRIILQDVQNNSTVSPSLKTLLPIAQNITNKESLNLNTFEKSQSDEILIKRHIHEKDVPLSMFKSTKSGIATPTPEKQKWPVVELLSESDEFNTENLQYFDEVNKKPFPFFHDIKKESKIIELPPKIVNNYNLELQNNQSEEKAVGLRSLVGRVRGLSHVQPSDDCACEMARSTIHKCPSTKECTRTTVSFSIMTIYMPYDMINMPKFITTGCPTAIPPAPTTSIPKFISPAGTFAPPMGLPVGVPMGLPMGVPVGFPVGIPANFPMGFPGGSLAVCPSGIPHSYYQLYAYNNKSPKKSSTAKLREELYYDSDEAIENNYIYNDDDDCTNTIDKKRKHDKKYKGDIIIDIAYDEKHSKHKLSRNPPINEPPENFVKGLCNDFKTSGETIIEDWYCSSAYSMKPQIVFYLVTLLFLY